MTTVNLTNPSTNVVSGQNFTSGGSGSSYTVDSDSNNNSNAILITVSSGPVTISHTSRVIGESFTITPGSGSGNYSVVLSQSVTTSSGGKGGSSTTTVYTARVDGNVAASSTPSPTYSISAGNMNEGASQNVSVTTTNFGSGTLYWSIDGGTDFSATSGSVSISNNSGTISITATADSTTEGNETKTIRLRTGSTSGTQVASDTFTVNDTSTTPAPTYSLGSASALDEGSYQNISVTTTNFGSGTLYYTLSPSADFTTSSGSVSITNNSGSITVTASDDSTTEGAETGTLRLRTGSTSGTVVATRTFTINDTSTGGSSGSGGSSTGSGTGGDTYGIEIYGPNGSTTVLGNNLRAQSVIYFATSTFNNNQTYTITGIPNANDSSKTQIIADFLGGSTNVPVTIVRYSNYFTIKQTSGGNRTARLVVIRIA